MKKFVECALVKLFNEKPTEECFKAYYALRDHLNTKINISTIEYGKNF